MEGRLTNETTEKAKEQKPTIWVIYLSDRAQQEIERSDPDEQRIWFAKPHGRGHILHSIEKNLEDLFYAQGGFRDEKGWMRVIWHENDEEQEEERGIL